MNVLIEAIGKGDESVGELSLACGCHAATRVIRTEHGPEIRFAHALLLVFCSWHGEIQRTFERLAGGPLAFPVWVPEGNPFCCSREECGVPVVGLRQELALPHRYFPHGQYVPVCAAHQGYPQTWVPLDLARFDLPEASP